VLGRLRADAAGRETSRHVATASDARPATAVHADEVIGALPPDMRVAGVGDEIVDRLGELRGREIDVTRLRSTRRSQIVERAMRDVLLDAEQPLLEATARFDAGPVAAGVDRPLRELLATPELLDAEIDVVSPLVPFLRWDPIQPPAVVSRHEYSAGESLRQMVVRSGVTQDPATLEITVTDPADYAAANSSLGYRATAERHLVPPKTSQSEAELHGAFDGAIGSTDPADHLRLLAVARRENGTLFDVDVPRLDDPSIRDPQPGIALLAGPDTPVAELKTLPLPPGEAPFPGQYVVHDTEELVVPYLPDVLGRGISVVFHEAGRDRTIPFPWGTEGFTAPYLGDWPERRSFRLALSGSGALHGALDGTELAISLPPGDFQRFRLSSSMTQADLDLFGLWRILPAILRDNPDLGGAAADGWLWALTPFDEVTLVHAVPRPVKAPRATVFLPVRTPGSTTVPIVAGVELDGPSTESLTAECQWTDPVDDLTLPMWEEQSRTGVAFTTPVLPWEDLALLGGVIPADIDADLPVFGPARLHRAVHELGDTRHHTIRYQLRAATRFREYFDAAALAPGGPPAPGEAFDDGQSVVGPVIEVNVPNTARPPAPIIHSVIPLFRWDDGIEPEQPVARRTRRQAGVRIYLERPWFLTGEGELLGVLVAPLGRDGALSGKVSQWGSDPVWFSAPVGQRGVLTFDHLVRAVGLDDRQGDAAPDTRPRFHPLSNDDGAPTVGVVGYQPQYNEERQLWYVDVAIHPGDTIWPFIRLAVARYQPDSLNAFHLSEPVRCDFVQLPPERTASVSRTDTRHVRVVLSGPIGLHDIPESTGIAGGRLTADAIHQLVAANRKVVARLQRQDRMIPTDLGWETVAATELIVRGSGGSPAEAAWVGTLESPEEIPLQQPGDLAEWRVTIEEWERLRGDPASLAPDAPTEPRVWEQRLVFAADVLL